MGPFGQLSLSLSLSLSPSLSFALYLPRPQVTVLNTVVSRGSESPLHLFHKWVLPACLIYQTPNISSVCVSPLLTETKKWWASLKVKKICLHHKSLSGATLNWNLSKGPVYMTPFSTKNWKCFMCFSHVHVIAKTRQKLEFENVMCMCIRVCTGTLLFLYKVTSPTIGLAAEYSVFSQFFVDLCDWRQQSSVRGKPKGNQFLL